MDKESNRLELSHVRYKKGYDRRVRMVNYKIKVGDYKYLN